MSSVLGDNCGELYYHDDKFFLLDTKDYEPTNPNRGQLGPLAMYNTAEYNERLQVVKETGDARAFFDTPDQHTTFSEGEMTALSAYAGAGHLDSERFREDGVSVIARESMSDLTTDEITRHAARVALMAETPQLQSA
jgi:hypothetical protein